MPVDRPNPLDVLRLVRAAPVMGAIVGGGLMTTTQAMAFCRTTTCSTADGPCERDPGTGCVTDGQALFWSTPCVSFGVHTDGSPERRISFEQSERAAAQSFQTWISADCGSDERPSINVVPRGELFCDRVEFNHDPPAPNTNLVVFRDREWPHCDDPDSRACARDPTIALTTVTYVRDTGEILDADIEINSANVELSTSAEDVSTDLRSVLTHEIGHFFGLSHTTEPLASMNALYDSGDISFRSLHRDDAAGMCAIYDPGEADQDRCAAEQPRNGFSRYCGSERDDPAAEPLQADAACLCAAPGLTQQTDATTSWFSLVVLLALAGRRRAGAELQPKSRFSPTDIG